MRLFTLLSIVAVLFFSGCDPKVDQRAPRYTQTECPSCKEGVCAHCHGEKACTQCNGTGTRVTSTKNYTGEGLKLVDIEETCPFCKGSKLCSYCDGNGKCYQCDGTREVNSENWEESKTKYTEKKEG